MSGNLLDNFEFPEVARTDFIAKGLVGRTIQSGNGGVVTEFHMIGSDRGISHRYFIEAVPNRVKSELADMEINDEVEMIEWWVTKDHKPTERCKLVGEKLLKFNKQGECVGGAYRESYLRWKAGLGAEGLPIERWGKLSIGQVKTLQSEGIFTVEQFASMSRDRVEGAHFPKELKDAFQAAIYFVNAQNPTTDIQKFVDQLAEMKHENVKKDHELQAMREQLQALIAEKHAPKAKKKTKKVELEVEGGTDAD